MNTNMSLSKKRVILRDTHLLELKLPFKISQIIIVVETITDHRQDNMCLRWDFDGSSMDCVIDLMICSELLFYDDHENMCIRG